MAGFTESVLQRKLDDLNESQQSIQTLSLWLIHHRKHHQLVVKTWMKEMTKGPELHKLTLMYLANDVIQNSKRKGPEYTKEFVIALKKAFQNLSSCKITPRTRQKLDRILQIWEERNVYDKKQVDEFRKILKGELDVPTAQGQQHQNNEPPSKKLKTQDLSKSISSNHSSKTKEEITLRISTPTVEDPPELDELIKALLELENSASVDVAVREKIAKLPPEVSEAKLVAKIENKEEAIRLAEGVNEAVELLTAYNNRLAAEMSDRKKVGQMLKDYTAVQKQLWHQAEARLEEYKEKLVKVQQVRHEILSHLSNLPDITKLTDLNSGLAPLPAAGDLFT